MSEKENIQETDDVDLELKDSAPPTPADSQTTTPVSTPRKQPSGVAPSSGAMLASPARSSAVTIIGGGKRQRLGSGNGASAGAGASGGSFGALGAVPPSPPKFASLDEIVNAATGVKNMALAHEIAVDKDFEIKKADPSSSFEGAFKSILHKAFWDLMEERLKEDPPDYESAISVFDDIKKLFDAVLLPQHQRLRKQIEEVLDMDVIRQQVDAGTIEPYGYTSFVLDLMSKLCAPARDDDIAALRLLQESRSDLVQLFRGILETLELMRIDMANFTIQQMRPFIQSQSVEYEKSKFADFLKTQTDGLFHTRAWLKSALVRGESGAGAAGAASAAAAASAVTTVPPPPTPAAALSDAFVSLLFWDDTRPFPETLLMDEGRLLHLRDEFYRVCLIGGILLVIYNVIGAPIAGLASLKGQLKNKIQILLGPVASEVKDAQSGPPLVAPFTSDQSAKDHHRSQLKEKLTQIFETTKIDVSKSLADHGFPPPSDIAWESLKGQLVGMEASDEHPIMKIVFKRLSSFVKSVMTMESKVNVQIPAGLSGLQKEIIDMVASFMRIVTHNRAVFGDYYQDIIHALTRPAST